MKNFIVDEEDAGERLDRFLHKNVHNVTDPLSRSKIQELVELGYILVNKNPTKAAYKLKKGDHIQLTLPRPISTELKALDLPLKILYEDDQCIVIDKPSGLVVHPAAGHEQDTLVNALLHKVKDLSIGFAERRPGIVHRLDKDTAGILVVAKTNQALENLSRQFKNKTVHRHYHALVYGKPPKTSGTIESLLQRHPTHRKKFASSTQGKKAITHFKWLEEKRGISLIRCKLETGRTHQIRVHMSEMGCPIVGDPIYSTSRRLKGLSHEVQDSIKNLNGIGLHAYELGFRHPQTQEDLHFQEDWPSNLYPLVKMLGLSHV